MPFRQPPAPLLVEDPPSTEDGSDLEDVKLPNDPALLNGSSGNFGSAGARSAPVTPQGVHPNATLSTPGAIVGAESHTCAGCSSPAIQRSPSHSVFTKCDKASLKQLSTSTPAMTAQAHLTEPPSPKSAKVPKVHTTSKGRQKKFNRHFPSVENEEKVLNHYSCALIGDILLQGNLYITKNYFAFYSNVFGYVTKLLIPMLTVENITKEKTARIIPNAIGIATSEDKHVFGSLLSRDNTFQLMNKVWNAAKSEVQVEPELLEPVPITDTDSSGTREGESGAESSKPNLATLPKVTTINSESPTLQDVLAAKTDAQPAAPLAALRRSLSSAAALPRHSLLLVATTLLLALLFLSAGVLLYRIGRVQHRYAASLHETLAAHGVDDVYGNLLQYQGELHAKSAGAVRNFLDSNLDELARVRQSLEALSTLLVASKQREERANEES